MRLAYPLLATLFVAGCDTPTTSTTSTPPETSPRITTNRPELPDYSNDKSPDNTAVNERDRNPNAKTPINQNENQMDINITADIRKEVLAQEGLSINARNAKIITANGIVTLRGPVESTAERDILDKIARARVGDANVENQLEVNN